MEITHARPQREQRTLLLDQMWAPAPTSDSEPPEIEGIPLRYGDDPALITVLGDGQGPHAVLHTPDEATHLSSQEADAIRIGCEEWQPTRREKALIHYACEGAYEEVAAKGGHDTSLCYILSQIEAATSHRNSYDHEPKRFGSAGAARHG